MALILNLYQDGICKDIGLQCGIGVAGITGTLANKSAWVAMTSYGIYFKRGGIATAGGVILSGATPIFNLASIPDLEILSDPTKALISDKVSNGSSTYIYNAYFAGIASTSGTLTSNVIRFYGSQSQGSSYPTGGIQFRRYTQSPADAGMQQRATWNYLDASGYDFWSQMQGALERCIMVYKLNIWETDFYLFAIGVSAGGDLNNNMTIVLIPTVHFEDKEIKPYVGPVSKDSAASSFMPTKAYNDSIAGRDLTNKRNPIGFNTGNGLRLFEMQNAQYSLLLYSIYSGSSDSLLNFAGQLIDKVAGGDGHRPAEEVQPMTQGVLCCHIVPRIVAYGSNTDYLKSIAGYRLSLAGIPGLVCGNSIYNYSSGAVYIEPRLNSFLDYEPYTSIICHLPFMGDISLSPSAVYGNAIQAEYELDIYTGILSCNLFIIAQDNTYIISTQQAKISTDLPVIGAAGNQNAIGTIAQATGALSRSRMQQARAQEVGTQAAQAAAAANTAATAAGTAITALDAISRAGNAVPAGGSSIEGIGNYLVSRSAYLIITRPDPALPGNYAELQGAVINKEGIVSEFPGYAEFSAVDLSGIDATESEKAEILALLRGGVFI